jgi:hypothetical protein
MKFWNLFWQKQDQKLILLYWSICKNAAYYYKLDESKVFQYYSPFVNAAVAIVPLIKTIALQRFVEINF